jgi:hypothetical protein
MKERNKMMRYKVDSKDPCRCTDDCINPKSKKLCKNWDSFFRGCNLLQYKINKDIFHPELNYKMRWIIERVGCKSFEEFVEENK